MIEQTGAAPNQGHIKNNNRNVFSMVKSERMGGSVPRWAAPETPVERIQDNLTTASALSDPNSHQPQDFKSALSYAGDASTSDVAPAYNPEEFTAGDLVDMVNPLHHIPVVGGLYRDLTGDEIKPISQIVGGAVFGGPIGAASGVVNVALEAETGEDMTGHAINAVFGGSETGALEVRELNDIQPAAGVFDSEDLPASLLAFTDQSNTIGFKSERISPHTLLKSDFVTPSGQKMDAEILLDLPAREPITTFELSSAATRPEKRSYNT